MNAQEFGAQIHGTRRSGSGYVGQCPAHDDRRASLSWQDGDKGIIAKCHAGCTIEAITGAMGLMPASLFFEPRAQSTPPASRIITAHYPYKDEQGTVLYEVLRYQPKDFRQRKPDGLGGWTWKLDGVRRVLYQLPGIAGQPEVYIVEGERDADRLTALGLSATTQAGGAGKWDPAYSAWLAANGVRRVVVLPDNDPPGEAHGITVAKACLAAGLEVRLIYLPGLSPKGDVSDWLDAGQTAEDLQSLVAAAPIFTGKTTPLGIIHIADAILALAHSLEEDPPEFLSTPFPNLNRLLCGGIVPGELYYLAAKGGEGKSALAIELARSMSKTNGVMVVSQEMGLAAITRRFIAQQGQISATRLRQHALLDSDWAKFTKAAGELSNRSLYLVEHAPTVSEIVARLQQTEGVKLVIIDYLQLLHGEGRDGRAQIEAVSRGLKAMVKKYKVAAFCLSAVSARGEGNHKPSMSWLRGSGMLEHDPDVILLLHQPNPKDSTRELIIAKARDAMCGSVTLQFSPDIVHFVETETERQPSGDYWEKV